MVVLPSRHSRRSTIAFDSSVAHVASSTGSVVLNCSGTRGFNKLEKDPTIHQAPFVFAMALATLTMAPTVPKLLWFRTDPSWISSPRPWI